MEEVEIETMLDRLVALGIAEDRGGDVGTTREWNARLRRAGEELNAEISRTGVSPAGNPLVLAVERALEREPFEGRDREVAVHVLVLLEVARMEPHEREKVGLGKLRFP